MFNENRESLKAISLSNCNEFETLDITVYQFKKLYKTCNQKSLLYS